MSANEHGKEAGTTVHAYGCPCGFCMLGVTKPVKPSCYSCGPTVTAIAEIKWFSRFDDKPYVGWDKPYYVCLKHIKSFVKPGNGSWWVAIRRFGQAHDYEFK